MQIEDGSISPMCVRKGYNFRLMVDGGEKLFVPDPAAVSKAFFGCDNFYFCSCIFAKGLPGIVVTWKLLRGYQDVFTLADSQIPGNSCQAVRCGGNDCDPFSAFCIDESCECSSKVLRDLKEIF